MNERNSATTKVGTSVKDLSLSLPHSLTHTHTHTHTRVPPSSLPPCRLCLRRKSPKTDSPSHEEASERAHFIVAQQCRSYTALHYGSHNFDSQNTSHDRETATLFSCIKNESGIACITISRLPGTSVNRHATFIKASGQESHFWNWVAAKDLSQEME